MVGGRRSSRAIAAVIARWPEELRWRRDAEEKSGQHSDGCHSAHMRSGGQRSAGCSWAGEDGSRRELDKDVGWWTMVARCVGDPRGRWWWPVRRRRHEGKVMAVVVCGV
jgi:hypothetical protein